ncbi:histidine phosphatase family protein [Brevibacterium litoralis]|uniref:histidine phosphatase family protein n=1 Tax=Brevibacterium litoralis TaxID=3138935 RepID=UPI0032ED87EE
MVMILLVRHGESTANVGGVLAGRTPGVELTPAGVRQARALGGYVPTDRLVLVHRSPLHRCIQTAELFLEGFAGGAPEVVEDPDLVEIDYGAWTGRKVTELTDEPLWKTVRSTPSQAVFPEGEGLAVASTRAIAAFDRAVGLLREDAARLKAEHERRAAEAKVATVAGSEPDGQSTASERAGSAGEKPKPPPPSVGVLVSHGDVIKAILAHALGMPLDEFQRLAVAPGSFSCIHVPDEGAPTVTAMSVTVPLPSEPVAETTSGSATADAGAGGQGASGAREVSGRSRTAEPGVIGGGV